ncbi:MAG: hypothetical protein FJ211_09130 [Ignavibacteria bacterium]|nr:hypothetical protein [Ignavibacteria bacterium]
MQILHKRAPFGLGIAAADAWLQAAANPSPAMGHQKLNSSGHRRVRIVLHGSVASGLDVSQQIAPDRAAG